MKKVMIAGCLVLAALLFGQGKLVGLAATAYPADWEVSSENHADCCYLTSEAHEGNYAFAQGMEAGYISSAYQEVKDLPEGVYTLAGYVKSSGGQKNCWISIKDYGGAEQRGNITFSDEWSRVSIEGIRITSGKAVVSIWTETDKAAWSLVDDLSLVGPDGKNYLKNGDFEEINSSSEAVEASIHPTPDQAPPKEAVSRYFEKWSIFAEPTADVAYTVKGGHTGEYCGVHYSGTASYAVSTAQMLAGLPKGTYGGSVWVKNSGGQKSATLVINVDGTKYNKDLPVCDEWVLAELTDIPVTGGTLEISVWSESPAGCWIKYDDMEVHNMDSPGENLLNNGSFETLGEAPKEEEEAVDTGAQGAAEVKPEPEEAPQEEGGMELNEEEDFPYDLDAAAQQPEPESEAGMDVLLVIGICVIILCFLLSVAILVLLLVRGRRKGDGAKTRGKAG